MTTSTRQQQQDRLSQEQRDLLDRLQTSLETGLTHDQVRLRRMSSTTSNVVDPPIKCPSWVCCLLPCIKHVPSMKAYRAMVPQDAEVKRSGKWVRYDASSIWVGDVIRIEAGDVVPADGVVLLVVGTQNDHHEPLLVDLRSVTGEAKPRAITASSTTTSNLYWGGLVVQGTAVCVVTAIGPDTRVAQLIRNKQFPPPPIDDDDYEEADGGRGCPTLDGHDEDERSASSSSSASNVHADQGISLLSRRVA